VGARAHGCGAARLGRRALLAGRVRCWGVSRVAELARAVLAEPRPLRLDTGQRVAGRERAPWQTGVELVRVKSETRREWAAVRRSRRRETARFGSHRGKPLAGSTTSGRVEVIGRQRADQHHLETYRAPCKRRTVGASQHLDVGKLSCTNQVTVELNLLRSTGLAVGSHLAVLLGATQVWSNRRSALAFASHHRRRESATSEAPRPAALQRGSPNPDFEEREEQCCGASCLSCTAMVSDVWPPCTLVRRARRHASS